MNVKRTKRREQILPVVALCLLVTLFVTAQERNEWKSVRRGLNNQDLNSVIFTDARRGWIGGDAGTVLRTQDGGATWTRQTVAGVEAGINDIYFRGRDDGLFLAANGIYTTPDGGATWREARRFAPAEFDGAFPELYSVRFANKRRGWVVGSVSRRDTVVDSLLLRTEDGGASWVRDRAPAREELINLDFVNAERGWVVGAAGTILRTADGGRTWKQLRLGTNAGLYSVNFRNERVGWAVGERGTILRTTDGGDSWFPVQVSLRSTLLSVRFVNDDDGFIVGRGGVILRTTDGGRTWARQPSGTTQNLYSLFVDKRNAWAVGGDGLVLQYER
ncbi:MAG: YCF48-related protein [Pyrinomonadaceae bacterium]